MSGQLMLINPKKRTGRTAAQKAATKRLVALNKKRKPSKAEKRSGKVSSVVRKMKKRARNPIGGSIAAMVKPVLIGGVGAVAVNTLQHQVVSRFITDPALKANKYVKYGSRVGIALALGALGGRFIGKANARQAAEGALTVAVHDVIVETVNTFLTADPTKPNNTLAAMDNPAYFEESGDGLGAYVESGVAGYGNAENDYNLL